MSKLTKSDLLAAAAEIFGRNEYQNTTELYGTEDGQFFEKNQATDGAVRAHKTATGNDFFVITRAEAQGTEPISHEAADKPLEKMTKAELAAFGSKLGLEILEDQTKAAIIEQIKGAKLPE